MADMMRPIERFDESASHLACRLDRSPDGARLISRLDQHVEPSGED